MPEPEPIPVPPEPSAGPEPERASPGNPVGQAAAATGRALAAAGAWLGRSVAAAYRAVDPDLRLHLAQLPLVGLTMLVRERTTPEPLPDDGRRPLVFVHGLGGGPGNFAPMQLYFRLHGRRRSYTVGFEGAHAMPELAARLSTFLEDVVTVNDLTPETRIDVVAHSMGGLIARLALEDPRTRARVGTLVTLSAPHAGSYLARYGHTRSSLDLRPDSAILARLARQLPWRGPPEFPRLIALWSPADVIVLPAHSAAVDGAENIELPGFTHYGYLIHPSGWRCVLDALDRCER
jgi:pimeloyl-ACP methyl ester carboxylesterase